MTAKIKNTAKKITTNKFINKKLSIISLKLVFEFSLVIYHDVSISSIILVHALLSPILRFAFSRQELKNLLSIFIR